MRYSARILAFGLLAASSSGCATCPSKITAALNRSAPTSTQSTTQAYTLACPDRILIWLQDRPDLSRELVIEPDGCIPLGQLGRVRVDGAAPADVAQLIAKSLNIPADHVKVTVVEHASKQLVIFGPGDGVQRVVAYIGPEKVTDLLRRTGGLSPGAAYNSVQVIRPHVATGRRPEVFPVDLGQIVMANDSSSDIVIQPNDQIYLGETSGSSIAKCLPPWVRGLVPGMKEMDEK